MKFLSAQILAVSALLGLAFAAPAEPTHGLSVPEPVTPGVSRRDVEFIPLEDAPTTLNITKSHGLTRRGIAPGTHLFSIGYALCGWAIVSPNSPPSGDSSENLFVWSASPENLGCNEHKQANAYNWSDRERAFTHWNVCGRAINFQPNGNTLDFFERNGNGGNANWLGRCYPWEGQRNWCLYSFGLGSCVVKTAYRCEASGADPVVCR